MNSRGVILLKRKDQIIPAQLLEKIVKDCPSVLGAAFCDATEKELFVMQEADEPFDKRMERMEQIMTDPETAGQEIIFHLGQFPESYSVDSIQPQILLESGEKKPLLVCFTEGIINDAELPKDNSNSPDYFLVQEYLIPKIQSMFDPNKFDLNELTSLMRTSMFQKEILRCFGPRGQLTILGANSEVLTFKKNELFAEFPWGWVSNPMGYKEGEYPAQGVVSAVKSMFGMKGKKNDTMAKHADEPAKETEKPAAPMPTDAPQPDVKPTVKEAAQNSTINSGPVEGKDFQMLSCPDTVRKEGKIKKWYRENSLNGIVPADYMKKPKVQCKMGTAVYRSFSDAAAAVKTDEPKPADAPKTTDTASVIAKTKDETTKHIPQVETKRVETKVTPADLPLLSSDEKKAGHEFVRKTLGFTGKKLEHDPEKIQELENKVPTFCQAFGIPSLAHTYNFSFPDLVEIAKHNPKALALLCMNYRAKLVMHELEKDKVSGDAPVEKPVSVDQQKAEQPAPKKVAAGGGKWSL